jgi:glyoxylase-like metal-dependent hydrolase (beta-lactamase superfamily II)
VLSNRHHLRNAERIAERFDCPILCHEAGLHEFKDGPEVEGFAFGDGLADDVTALPMDAICPEDTALRIDAGEGALLFADTLIHYGEIGFVPDNLIGENPEEVKRVAVQRASALLDEPFDHLLFAHGTPLIGGGKEALRAFADRF